MNKKKVMIVAFALILLISVIGLTYAYFAINQSNTSNQLSVETGALKLVLEDGTDEHGVVSGKISPNNKTFTAYLSITNEGPIDTFAKLFFRSLSNNFSNDLVYTIEEMNESGTSAKSMKVLKYQTPVPSANNEDKIITDGLLIKTGGVDSNNKVISHTQYYKVTIEYLYSDTKNQDIDLGKVFYTGFTLEEGERVNESMAFINNIEDLVKLAKEVNSGDNKSGKEYRLLRSLDFNSDDSYLDSTTTKYGDINKNGVIESIKTELTTSAGWVPIGTSYPFSGTFNGQNNEIQHLYINNNDETITRIGLFGKTVNGVIENLGVVNGNVKTTTLASIGSIAGYLVDSNMINCYNHNTNVNSTIATSHSLGGLIGGVQGGIVRNSHNKSIVDGMINVGGLIGYIEKTVLIDNCYNDATSIVGNGISATTGGLIGNTSENSTLTITNSHNSGKVINLAGHNAGGLVGISSITHLEVNDSYNDGDVTINPNNMRHIFAGGLIGQLNKSSFNINNFENRADIKNLRTSWSGTYWTYVAGLIGINYQSSQLSRIENSSNSGTISGGNRIGGIISLNESSNVIINNTYNKGHITSGIKSAQYGAIYAGGLVGMDYNNNKTYIINSFNDGIIDNDISTGNTDVNSGIVGSTFTNSSLYILNTYNSNIIKATKNDIYNTGMTYCADTSTINIQNAYNSTDTMGTVKYTNSYLNSGSIVAQNFYYNSSISSVSNSTAVTNNSLAMSSNNIKSSSFVTTLNNNRSSITLPNELNGYTLSTWCTSDNGPVLDFEVPDSERGTRCPAYSN